MSGKISRRFAAPASYTESFVPHITILLCTYNGARHLEAQLRSFHAQTHSDWSLWASDDGSTDGTQAILGRTQDPSGTPARVVRGPGQGFARNFLTLLDAPGLAPGYVALSDQDDVWYPDKLARAVAALSDLPPDTPALYCGRTRLTDGDLRPLRLSRRHRHFAFRNALVQNVVAGNTIVMTPAAHRLVQAAGVPDVPYHDWWCYMLVTGAGGHILYDPVPCMNYRQHAGNVQGENRSVLAVAARGGGFAGGVWRGWFQANLDALWDRRELLTDDHCALLAAHRARAAQGPFGRTRALAATGAYRQRGLETAALYAGSLLGWA